MSKNNMSLVSMTGLVPMHVELLVDGEKVSKVLFYDFSNSKTYESSEFKEVSADIVKVLGEAIMQEQILDAPTIPMDISSAMIQRANAQKQADVLNNFEIDKEDDMEKDDERVQSADKDSNSGEEG
jgi:hypothetical protein